MNKGFAIMASSAGSGKDTVADYLVELLENKGEWGYRLALGDPIHEYCEEIIGDSKKVTREHLQKFGESVRDIFGETTWIDFADRKIGFMSNNYCVPVISDIRKLSEFSHYFVEHDFCPIYVKTDIEVAKKRLKDRDGSYNPKDLKKDIETQLNFIESLPAIQVGDTKLKRVSMEKGGKLNNVYIVDNSGTLDELKEQVYVLFMEEFNARKLLS